MLMRIGKADRVSFNVEVEENGLRLCPSDMDRNNFLKDSGGKIVALDFGATCFLPISFFAFALSEVGDFGQVFVNKIKYPTPTQLTAMIEASYCSAPFNNNKLGKPILSYSSSNSFRGKNA